MKKFKEYNSSTEESVRLQSYIKCSLGILRQKGFTPSRAVITILGLIDENDYIKTDWVDAEYFVYSYIKGVMNKEIFND